MKLNELLINQQVIVQFKFNGETIEFCSNVIGQDMDGIYISPYLHNNMPLKLNINMDDSVICNIFADDVSKGQRVSWRNVCLSTVNKDSRMLYFIETSKFKALSNNEERRKKERIPVKKKAQLYDANNGTYTTIVINDVSENGISFYTNVNFAPSSYQLDIIFEDNIEEKLFNLNINSSVTRTEKQQGHLLYGCTIKGENKDFLLYVLLKKLSYKRYKMAI